MDEQFYRDLVLGRRRGLAASAIRLALRAASFPYSLAVQARNLAYDAGWRPSFRAAVPVVSVGNITVGGTGKTPVVEWVARWFRDRGLRTAILSRGYRSSGGRNDEALVLDQNLPDIPHLQSADRVSVARIAVDELRSEILVLDDGMQHRRLRRDLEIVLVDATCPFGGGWTLPGGLLREPLRGLARANLIAITRSNSVAADELERIVYQIRRHATECPIVQIELQPVDLWTTPPRLPHSPLLPLPNPPRPPSPSSTPSTDPSTLAGRDIAAFCGIGNPDSFRQTLRHLGANIVDFRIFPDHYAYSDRDVASLSRWASDCVADLVVTTQKDLVKLRMSELSGRPLVALRVAAVVTAGEGDFDRALASILPAASGFSG